MQGEIEMIEPSDDKLHALLKALASTLTKTPQFELIVRGMVARKEAFPSNETCSEFERHFGRKMYGVEQVEIELAARNRSR